MMLLAIASVEQQQRTGIRNNVKVKSRSITRIGDRDEEEAEQGAPDA